MPHIRLDTTSDLVENANIPDILTDLVAKLATFETIDSASIKAYHQLRSSWVMGEGATPGFAHCEVAILSGRSPQLRADISKGISDVMTRHFAYSLEQGDVKITVEVREMDRDTYFK